VLDGVDVLQASLFKELLKVVHGWPHLTLAAACGHHGMLHIRAACLLVDAIIVSHDRGLLTVLLAPFLVALLDILDGDVM
jgi:hypothetical protein